MKHIMKWFPFITKNESTTQIKNVIESKGTGGLYELAESWTDEFEKQNEGREWDGEFFDEVNSFLETKVG